MWKTPTVVERGGVNRDGAKDRGSGEKKCRRDLEQARATLQARRRDLEQAGHTLLAYGM